MKILNNLKSLIPVVATYSFKTETTLFFTKEQILFSIFFLKNHINLKFSILSCISGVDFLTSSYRFSIVYELLSISFNIRLRLKTFLNEISPIDSITPIFKNAGWWEREVWDLYGIYFKGNKDLRRILTDYGFEGYPMRKDYPLSGYVELRYDQNKKRVVVEALELAQDFRYFSFESVW